MAVSSVHRAPSLPPARPWPNKQQRTRAHAWERDSTSHPGAGGGLDARQGLAAWPYTLQAAGTERAFTTPAMPSIAWEVSGTEGLRIDLVNFQGACGAQWTGSTATGTRWMASCGHEYVRHSAHAVPRDLHVFLHRDAAFLQRGIGLRHQSYSRSVRVPAAQLRLKTSWTPRDAIASSGNHAAF